ncbi:MAG: hypothetical protein V3S07_07310 [Micropepsaceae bacterium]
MNIEIRFGSSPFGNKASFGEAGAEIKNGNKGLTAYLILKGGCGGQTGEKALSLSLNCSCDAQRSATFERM